MEKTESEIMAETIIRLENENKELKDFLKTADETNKQLLIWVKGMDLTIKQLNQTIELSQEKIRRLEKNTIVRSK